MKKLSAKLSCILKGCLFVGVFVSSASSVFANDQVALGVKPGEAHHPHPSKDDPYSKGDPASCHEVDVPAMAIGCKDPAHNWTTDIKYSCVKDGATVEFGSMAAGYVKFTCEDGKVQPVK